MTNYSNGEIIMAMMYELKNMDNRMKYAYYTFLDESPGFNWLSFKERIDILNNLSIYSKRLDRINTELCNGTTREVELHQRAERIKNKVSIIAHSLGFNVEFNDDPRGYSIKLYLPSGKSNSWDGKSFTVCW